MEVDLSRIVEIKNRINEITNILELHKQEMSYQECEALVEESTKLRDEGIRLVREQ